MRIDNNSGVESIGRCSGSIARPAKRATALAAGALVAWIGSTDRAYAGFSYVVSCASCQTTTDFVTVAKRTAGDQGEGGLYLVTSLSQSSSAYISVTGHIVTKGGEPEWVASAGIPVDAAGNSLAGDTEASLETFYLALDQIVFNASRDDPTLLILGSNAPIQSFINSNDTDVGAMINSLITDVRDGMSVTVVFPDGTRATFTAQVSPTGVVTWKWNGVAMQGNTPILRDGTPAGTKTAGNGGGEVSTPGFGLGSHTLFDLVGDGGCAYGGTISFPGGEDLTSFTWGKC